MELFESIFNKIFDLRSFSSAKVELYVASDITENAAPVSNSIGSDFPSTSSRTPIGWDAFDSTVCRLNSSTSLSSEVVARCFVFLDWLCELPFFLRQVGAMCPFLWQKLQTASTNLQSLAA